jgi:exodeoxyribonuclease V gamma subunit
VHLALLQALGAVSDIDLYALNPCREFWFDVVAPRRLAALQIQGRADFHEVGQPLLAAWGAQAQSQLALLVDAAGHAADDERYVAHDGRHLLARLHNAILDLQEPARGSVPVDATDRSLELHLCHSRTRELEVLQDRLLALFAGPDAPRPDEILVVTPDLEATAPAIDAIFGTAPRERHIPYAITGRARSRVNAPARAWLQLLALPASRCGVTEVYGLLQQDCVARRFGLGAEALERVHHWLRDAGVHWGLDAAHRAALGLSATAPHSLADGLDRLMLGYALPDEVGSPFAERLPAGGAEGAEAAWLGTLGRYAERLDRLRRATAAPLPPAQWPRLLGEALDDFIAPADDELEDLRELRDALQRLAAQWQHGGRQEPIALDAVRLALEQLLDDPARGGVPGGSVTFSSMHSLRSLPYRVVCCIGLDDGAFPGAGRSPEFDLMAISPRLGDRQRRIDDRNLFLDLLLAAQDVLHLSCVGRSVRDNAALPPSVLVSELLDAVTPWFADAAAALRRLVVEHPLQAFAERAFSVDSPAAVRSFQAEYCAALQARGAAPQRAPGPHTPFDALVDDTQDDDDDDTAFEPLPPFIGAPLSAPGPEWRVMTVERLAEFFRQPCRFLLRHRLGLSMREPGAEEDLADDEDFVPDGLSRIALARRLLPGLLRSGDLAAARRLARAGTEWPEGSFAAEALERELHALSAHAAAVTRRTATPCVPPVSTCLTLEVNGQAWRLDAGFADLRPEGLVRHRYADPGAHDLLGAWLWHLALCASPPPGVTPVTVWQGRDSAFGFEPVTDAAAQLRTLLSLVEQGLREPLYFFPRTAWAFVEGNDRVGAAVAEWRPFGSRYRGESHDAAVRLALRGRPDPLGDDALPRFSALAHAVFDPLRRAVSAEAAA